MVRKAESLFYLFRAKQQVHITATSLLAHIDLHSSPSDLCCRLRPHKLQVIQDLPVILPSPLCDWCLDGQSPSTSTVTWEEGEQVTCSLYMKVPSICFAPGSQTKWQGREGRVTMSN